MDLLANNYAAEGMFAAGMLILTILLLSRLRRYQHKNRGKARAEPKAPGTLQGIEETRAATPLLDAPPELLRWQVDMHETARDLKAELDSKMSALQAFIRMASEESDRLEMAIKRAKQLGVSSRADSLAMIEGLSEGNDFGDEIPSDSLPAIATDLEAKRVVVYQLADQGLAASAIAQSTGTPVGDVEMLISLRSESTS